ncbi:MAG: DNA polymerase [Thiotrichales bacterium SG8_50]|nr:MAG: DNA polymerase [Thiotrichales bacterium SG8_50]
MGISVWVPQGAERPSDSLSARPVEPSSVPVTASDDLWSSLRAQVSQCEACELHRTRTQTVFGVGDEQADWMVIGEAPGADEDRQGEPFVGRAGKLLTSMLSAMGIKREDVFIANILKCRPPKNRDPRPEEVAACEGYLCRQVELVRPRIILAVGRIAAQNLLKTDAPLARLRGRTFAYGDSQIPVVVTYHPAYLLRSPLDKRKAWQDLCYAMQVVAQS